MKCRCVTMVNQPVSDFPKGHFFLTASRNLFRIQIDNTSCSPSDFVKHMGKYDAHDFDHVSNCTPLSIDGLQERAAYKNTYKVPTKKSSLNISSL